ncbi:MAG: hypothetical protein K6E47_07805 [Lachnospiraceae bacterium]|nr:hypothetical protein [Lachnospiraceae bacterium]
MNFTSNAVEMTKEILKRKLGGEYLVPVTIASSEFAYTDVIKAGTPINADGEAASDTEYGGATTSDAVGILLNDVYVENPNGSLIKAFAAVNVANCPKVDNVSVITDAVKAALPLIAFE